MTKGGAVPGIRTVLSVSELGGKGDSGKSHFRSATTPKTAIYHSQSKCGFYLTYVAKYLRATSICYILTPRPKRREAS
jgi:hypothetical protein